MEVLHSSSAVGEEAAQDLDLQVGGRERWRSAREMRGVGIGGRDEVFLCRGVPNHVIIDEC